MTTEDETQYGYVSGPTLVPIHRPRKMLTAADKMRLTRLAGTLDPAAPMNDRVWNGEAPEKTHRQKAGEDQNS